MRCYRLARLLLLALLAPAAPAAPAASVAPHPQPAAPTSLFLPLLDSASLLVYESDRETGWAIYQAGGDGSAPRALSEHRENSFGAIPAPSGRLVAYTSTRDGLYGIYVAGVDGGSPRRLISCSASCGVVGWSPDGTYILISRNTLYDGGTMWPSRIEHFFHLVDIWNPNLQGWWSHTTPVWSPDGSRMAYPANGEIFIAGPHGESPRRLTSGGAPRWSPDSRHLLIERGSAFPHEQMVVAVSGGPGSSLGAGLSARWSPDGTRVALISDDSQVFVMSANGGDKIKVADGYNAVWSPDGRRLAFSYRAETSGVAVVNADGSGLLDMGPGDISWAGGLPGWSPDGRLLLARSASPEVDRHVMLFAADGSTIVDLGYGEQAGWSPDGQWIAVLRGSAPDSYELSIFDRAGLLVTTTSGAAMPRWSRGGAAMIFSRYRSAPGQVYISQVDGSGERLLAAGQKPQLDRSGAWVALVDDGAVVVMSSSGGRLHRAPLAILSDTLPAWSPAGARLAFFGADGWLYDWGEASGQFGRRLACPSAACATPVWSPDGRHLAVLAAGAAGASLHVLDREDGSSRRLADCGADGCSPPSWSPDGGRLTFAAGQRVRVAEIAGGTVRDLAAGRSPLWSPRDERIAYEMVTPQAEAALALIAPDGTAPAGIQSCPSTCSLKLLAWTPQGDGLIYRLGQCDIKVCSEWTGIVTLDGRQWQVPFPLAWIGSTPRAIWPCLKPNDYQVAYAITASGYTKLCLGVPGSTEERSFPRGHGNVRFFDLAAGG